VRKIYGQNREEISEAGPGMPVEIGGWKGDPKVGELVQHFATEVG